MPNLKPLTNLMTALRHSDSGCPWSIRQTSQSIARYTLEETYELLHAIEANDIENIKEELGDLLFHVVFHSHIAAQNGLFDIDDVISEIVKKMTRRHPHVFEESRSNGISDEELDAQWKHTKSMDKAHPKRVLDEVGQKLPAMIRAQLLQEAAAEYSFDWPHAEPVLNKIEEEIGELREALAQGNINHIQSEMGDVLFACINLARHIEVDAESALRQTNEKFVRRFDYVVHQMQQAGIDFSPQQLQQMELFWQQSKKVTG